MNRAVGQSSSVAAHPSRVARRKIRSRFLAWVGSCRRRCPRVGKTPAALGGGNDAAEGRALVRWTSRGDRRRARIAAPAASRRDRRRAFPVPATPRASRIRRSRIPSPCAFTITRAPTRRRRSAAHATPSQASRRSRPEHGCRSLRRPGGDDRARERKEPAQAIHDPAPHPSQLRRRKAARRADLDESGGRDRSRGGTQSSRAGRPSSARRPIRETPTRKPSRDSERARRGAVGQGEAREGRLNAPVNVTRGTEEQTFPLTKCDGSALPRAVEEMSILVRPGSAAKPAAPIAGAQAKTESGTTKADELAPGIRKIDERLVQRLQLVIDHFAKPAASPDGDSPHAAAKPKIFVVSGYRPTSKSFHAIGRAIDFRLDGVENTDLVAFCKTLPDTGCGFYPEQLLHSPRRPRFRRGPRLVDRRERPRREARLPRLLAAAAEGRRGSGQAAREARRAAAAPAARSGQAGRRREAHGEVPPAGARRLRHAKARRPVTNGAQAARWRFRWVGFSRWRKIPRSRCSL